jgi:hypothetical protein
MRMDLDLDVVSGRGEGDGGVPRGALLMRFADAVVEGSDEELREVREELERTVGSAAFIDAAAVVAIFCCNVRIADATGIPLDENSATVREDVGRRVGIARYHEPQTAPG